MEQRKTEEEERISIQSLASIQDSHKKSNIRKGQHPGFFALPQVFPPTGWG
jgi:hypothetical protein